MGFYVRFTIQQNYLKHKTSSFTKIVETKREFFKQDLRNWCLQMLYIQSEVVLFIFYKNN